MSGLWYKDVPYEDAKELVKESLTNTVGAFIAAGYWLKYIRERKEYEKEGYISLWDMAENEFGLKKSEASRAMGMNDRYSQDGNSPFLLEKYMGYNKSQLQEMLTMTEEQMEQVTPDMKVQQMREMKHVAKSQEAVITGTEVVVQWEKSETEVETLQEVVENVTEELLETEIVEEIEDEEEEIAEVLEFEILDEEMAAEIEDEEEKEIIIDGEFRELSEEEAVETEPEETIGAAEESELSLVKRILANEKELLQEYLKIEDLPVFTVKRQKIIVAALANMVCELEEVEQEIQEVP